MDIIFDTLSGRHGDSSGTMLGLLVFLAASVFAFSMMALVRVRGAVRRRAAVIGLDPGSASIGSGSRSLRGTSAAAAKKLLDYTTKHYSGTNDDTMKVLRRRMVQAGFFDPRAVAYFFISRTLLAVVLAAAVFAIMPAISSKGGSVFWLVVMAGGIAGYVGPSVFLDRVIATRRNEYRAGFPDFMDLLVVCADSGLSMEAALDRVGREIADTYPALSANIHMTNLEIRAGRTMVDALEHLAERLGLDEARSFSTLIGQSAELGSSITDALRVYSDDMRHKRLSLAEEKAYSLPSKLAVPMMVCIFPVLFVVILLPVIVRLSTGNWN